MLEYLLIAEEVADAKFGKARLPGSQQFAGAANLEILFGD